MGNFVACELTGLVISKRLSTKNCHEQVCQRPKAGLRLNAGIVHVHVHKIRLQMRTIEY